LRAELQIPGALDSALPAACAHRGRLEGDSAWDEARCRDGDALVVL